MNTQPILQGIASVVVFGVIGIVLFALAIKIIQKTVPFSLRSWPS